MRNCGVEEHSNVAAIAVVAEVVSGGRGSILRWCSWSGISRRRGVGHSLMSVAIDGG